MDWEKIKCKECGTQSGRMFMMPRPIDSEDVYCEEHHKPEIERRAKSL